MFLPSLQGINDALTHYELSEGVADGEVEG